MGYRNIVELLDRSKIESNKTFAVLPDRKVSYAQLLDQIEKLNSYLHPLNIAESSRFLVAVEDDFNRMLIFIGLMRIGHTPILLDVNTNKSRAKQIIDNSDISAAFVEQRLVSSWDLEGVEFIFQVKRSQSAPKSKLFNKLLKKTDQNGDSESFPAVLEGITDVHDLPKSIDSSSIAAILYTSGTTDNPKGVMISHHNLFSHLETLKKTYSLSGDSRILNVLSLSHVDGMFQGPLMTLYCGGSLYRPVCFDVARVPELLGSVYKYRITHFITAPAMLRIILRFDEYEDSFKTEDFEFISSSSSILDEKLWLDFEKKFGVALVNVYGLTETVVGSLFSGPDDSIKKIGTIGKPVDCEVKLINEDGEEDLQGELVIKGDHITQGYFNNPDATSTALKEGWFYTGDICEKDTDGFYKIIGRKKNIVISGGFNIHPEEVNELLAQEEDIVESCCFGTKDDIHGEVLVACIVVKSGSNLNASQLQSSLSGKTEKYKIPKQFSFVAELPKGLSGKVDINRLKELIQFEEKNGSQSNTVFEQVATIAARSFNVNQEAIESSSSSMNLDGWDSMAHLDFITALEGHFGLQFSTSDIIKIDNISVAVEIISKRI